MPNSSNSSVVQCTCKSSQLEFERPGFESKLYLKFFLTCTCVYQGPNTLYMYMYILADDHGLFRKHIHSGSSHGFSFQVQFVAREDKVCVLAESVL